MNEITERYSRETESPLGCANLSPFFTIKKGNRILDLGCGNGSQAAQLKARYGAEVTGLDLTAAMIAKAQANHPGLSFVQGDIHLLPFESEAFDVVTSNCVINHSRDKKRVFAEIGRVLAPGGHFLIGDVCAVDRLPEEVSNDPVAIAACYGGAIPKEEYLEIIRSLGFIWIEQLASRTYPKAGFLLESLVIRGFKPPILTQ